MKRITITHHGFHGMTTVRLRVKDGQTVGCPRDTVSTIYLSESQARKLDRAACGMPACRCGESILRAICWQSFSGDPMGYDGWNLPLQGESAKITSGRCEIEVEVRGNYAHYPY